MGTVNSWVGTIGGTILVLELIVMLILMVGINLALVLVLRWVLGKQSMVHEKIVWAQALIDRYVNKGADLAAAPVIRTTSAWRGLKVTIRRALHWPAQVPVLAAHETQARIDASHAA